MATQKDTKMSLRMKGAFGKMKSSKMKFNMSKPHTKSGASSKQLKNMFNRFNKKTDGDDRWSAILTGSWEIELPVAEFLNAEPPSSASDKKENHSPAAVNDPNSVSNQQCPMVQIYENLKVISIPLSTDIANPHIHQKYLSSKHISTNSTRIKVGKEKDNKILLINYKSTTDDADDVILEGTIDCEAYTIRWGDGSSWAKQGLIHKKEDEEDMQTDTPSMTETDTMANSHEMKELRSQLEILKEKEQMAKSQTQATMGQFADLSQQYAKLTTEHENLQKEHEELRCEYDGRKTEFNEMKETLQRNNEELHKVRGDMVFEKQQQIQTRLTKYKQENEEYAKSIKLQQERILSLQDQLQSSHIATRQYTKTIEDLEAKISVIDKEKLETKAVLNEMNNKFVTSQTNLDDAKHKEMLVTDRHLKEIETMCVKHRQEIDKLERGFQETLRQNERKMQELQTLRNNYEKKNASLTKDVKRLIIQVEKQTKSFKSNSVTQSITFSGIGDDNEAVKKLREENAQLSQELIRKSQSLVNALRALAEFHQNPQNITKAITSNLSQARQLQHVYNDNGFDPNARHNADHALASYVDVSNQLQAAMEQNLQNKARANADASGSAVPPDSNSANDDDNNNNNNNDATPSPVVFGAQYGIDDLPGSTTSTKLKFNRFKNKMGNKMKQQITKLQQNMVKDQLQRMKSSEDETLNELNARSAIKESEKIIITKTKQQLNSQCGELQGLANELSSTIEQKEVILESLRFANTYLGKRVIALERLMKMHPGTEIKNQDELIRDALNICSEEMDDNSDKEEPEEEVKTEEITVDDKEREDMNANENNEENDAMEAKTEEFVQNTREEEAVENVEEAAAEEEEVGTHEEERVELDVVSGGDPNENTALQESITDEIEERNKDDDTPLIEDDTTNDNDNDNDNEESNVQNDE